MFEWTPPDISNGQLPRTVVAESARRVFRERARRAGLRLFAPTSRAKYRVSFAGLAHPWLLRSQVDLLRRFAGKIVHAPRTAALYASPIRADTSLIRRPRVTPTAFAFGLEALAGGIAHLFSAP